MEILQFLLNFFLKDNGGGALKELLNLFSQNSFDLKKVLANLNPETLAPIIENFMNGTKKENPIKSTGFSYGLSPISKIADKDIVYTLNQHFDQSAL